MLIQLGAEEVRLKSAPEGREVPAAALKEMLTLLDRLSRYSDAMRRHGGDFEDFLNNRSATGHLPQYLVRIREGNEDHIRYFADQDALRAFHQENPDLELFEPDPEPEPAPQLDENGQPIAVEVAPAADAPKTTRGKKKEEGPRRR